MMSYRNRTIAQHLESVRSGTSDVRSLADACRAEIERYEPRLRAWERWSDLDHELSRIPSDSAPLAGLMVGVKDVIDVAGLPTRCGSDLTKAEPANADAACVQRLRELGAVVQGKTVTTEFGYFSPGPTTNPYHEGHTPGGSSSGSAAAVGAGTIPFALGTQTAGSLTRPASYCGVAGLVLSGGSASLEGVRGLSPTLDALGLLARTVEDLDVVHRSFVGRGESDARDTRTLRVMVWEGSGLLNIDPDMAHLIRIAGRLLADVVDETALLDWDDHIRTLVDDHKVIMGFEAAHGLGQELGSQREQVSPQLRQLLDTGDSIDRDIYREAMFRREVSLASLLREIGEDTVIIGPAAQGAAPGLEEGTGSPELSRPWQLLGLPVLTVPGARTSRGMPLGVQLIGPCGSEATLLGLGAALEPRLRNLPSFRETDSRQTLKEMKW